VERDLFTDDHELFRETVRGFVRDEVLPNEARWEAEGIVDRTLFAKAGALGLLGFAVPVEHGGGGVRDFRYNQVLGEELQAEGLAAVGLGLALHTDIAMPYFLDLTTEEQKRAWLPGICSGELITAVAMTEPGAGSDLAGIRTTAIRDGDEYVVNGSKTFITNGINGDLVVTAVKTDPRERHAGMSLLVLERGMPGFERGRNLEKMGMHAQDTAELFFDDVRVPVANLLGQEGEGFVHLVHNLPQERLSLALAACAGARMAFDTTVTYCRERQAFGQKIGAFQNTRFALADLATELTIGQTFIDRCVVALNAGALTVEEAAMAKLWCTELQARAVDLGVQLHGGYGYMAEFPIAKAYVDARITRIYGGTSEVMREIVGRSLDL
jgi:alkylation response protein AidB-like acyl-CoA dehydrogenase